MPIRQVGQAEFDDVVLGSALPVLVDFGAPWCGPCRQFAPVLAEVAEELQGRMTFLHVDADADPDLAARYGVLSLPTFNVYQNGHLTKSIVGARPKRKFLDAVQEFAAGA